MTIDPETLELYTRLECAALEGLLGSNPGGSMHRKPEDMTNHAALMGAHGVIAHLQGLATLEKLLADYRRVAAAPQTAYAPPAPYAAPPVVRLAPPPAPTQAAAPALAAPATGTASPDSRTQKFVNSEMCPVCAGLRAEPSLNGDPQCPYFHYQPNGNVIPPTPPPAPPQGPPQGTPPVPPFTGVPPLPG